MDDADEKEVKRKSTPIVTISLVILIFAFPYIQNMITKDYVVDGLLKSMGEMPYKLGLLLTNVIGNLLHTGFKALLFLDTVTIIASLVFSVVVGVMIGGILESVFVKGKHREIIVVVTIFIFISYFIGLSTYLSKTSDSKIRTVSINTDYRFEITKVRGNIKEDALWVGFRILQDSNSKVINSIDIKIIKDNKQFLHKGGSEFHYNRVFNYVNVPFTIAIGQIELQPDNGSLPVVLSVYRNVEVKKILEESI